MEVINIEATLKSPKVLLDKDNGNFEINGRSIPENTSEFYAPIMDWLKEYGQSPNPQTDFQFKLEYFNTSSSKCILDICRIIEEMKQGGNDVKISWVYEEYDEDMLEAGEDYEAMVDVPFDIVMVKSEDEDLYK